ncbi:MAG: NUDIX hydrolase [Candidatus Hodarchaeales archaeon]|jgi:ADP-ribose pyrophosphatase
MPKEEKLRTLSTIHSKSFSVNLDEAKLPSGRITERIRVLHPDASAVIPILDDGRIILVKQFRYSIQEETLEIPAGKIDKGETAEECARRELEEETGYSAANLNFLLTYVPAIGYSNERLHIYKGTDLRRIPEYERSSDEISRLEILTMAEIAKKIYSGEIQDGKTIVAMALLKECFG